MQLLSDLHTEVVQKLTEWQLGYLERGDSASVDRIEEMQRVLSAASTTLMVFSTEIATSVAEARKWERRYTELNDNYEKEVQRLRRIIETEEYFLTKRKYNR